MPKSGTAQSANAKRKTNGLNGQVCVPQQGRLNEETVPASEKQTGQNSSREFIWNEDRPTSENYAALGERLAQCGVLFRSPQYGSGMLLLLPDGKHVTITRGPDLLPVIIDNVDVMVIKNGKASGTVISASHLNAMLKSNSFLDEFIKLDRISRVPMHLPGFSITQPGFNNGGPDHRVVYVGKDPEISWGLETITSFLDVMAFATKADRTNAVAALLTVQLWNHWPGGKPVILVTASKSHAGKDTVIMFATGLHRSVEIAYQPADWAVERSFVDAVKANPEVAVVVVGNARVDGHGEQIASAFLERFATDPEPQLFSTGSKGPPLRVRNSYVVAISTNFGTVSEDIMNRALPIHLNPVGNVAERQSPIGNPKEEFLPANKEKIASELYGMIEKWREAGQPLDDDVKHPFSIWAKTVGGILKVNGYTDFLANYGVRKTVDDPLRKALAILGADRPNQWLRSADWAKHVAVLGLTKAIIPPGDQDSDAGRMRGIGTVLSAHESETFVFEDDERRLVLKLEKKRGRFGEGQPHPHFQFAVVEETKQFDEPTTHEKPKPR